MDRILNTEVNGHTSFLYLQDTLVELIINILSVGKHKVSSNDAISLTDGSTETF